MFQSLLTAAVLLCLLAGRLPAAPLAAGCAAVFLGAWLLHRLRPHTHDDWTSVDFHAQQSRLGGVPAGLKALLTLGCIVLVLAAQAPAVSAFVLALAFALTVLAGGTPAGTFLRLFSVPASFVLLSGLALLFDFTRSPGGAISLPCFGGYLAVTAATQASALRIMLGAAASVACLYALCLSTPMYELIAALGRAHLPEILIELMYLIYRYIFVLSGTLSQMKTAAASRLGFSGSRAAMRSTGRIMTSLLASSFQKASASFDAMQSRCYAGRLRFLEQRKPIKPSHLAGSAAILAAVSLSIFLERVWLP